MRKRRAAQELRNQEKFMKVGSGEADCISCGYHYDPKIADPEYPIAPGTKFQVRCDQPVSAQSPHLRQSLSERVHRTCQRTGSAPCAGRSRTSSR